MYAVKYYNYVCGYTCIVMNAHKIVYVHHRHLEGNLITSLDDNTFTDLPALETL